MSDPINQNLNLINDDEDDQVKEDKTSTPKAVHAGGHVEGAPVSVESHQEVQKYVELSEKEPQISEEEEQAGVEVVKTEPKLHPDATAAGVKHSIPKGPNFNIKSSYTDEKQAQESFDKGDTTSANTFRALMFLKNLKQGLISMINPSKK